MRIEARAPTRIDLAGGTLDIWPLYLFHQPAFTLNCAINLYASCVLETHKNSKSIRLISLDTKKREEFSSWRALAEFFALPSTVARAVRETFSPAARLDDYHRFASPRWCRHFRIQRARCGACRRVRSSYALGCESSRLDPPKPRYRMRCAWRYNGHPGPLSRCIWRSQFNFVRSWRRTPLGTWRRHRRTRKAFSFVLHRQTAPLRNQ